MRNLLKFEALAISGGTSIVTYSPNNSINLKFSTSGGGFIFYPSSLHHKIEIYEAGNDSWFAIDGHYFDYPSTNGTINNFSVGKTSESNSTIYTLSW